VCAQQQGESAERNDSAQQQKEKRDALLAGLCRVAAVLCDAVSVGGVTLLLREPERCTRGQGAASSKAASSKAASSKAASEAASEAASKSEREKTQENEKRETQEFRQLLADLRAVTRLRALIEGRYQQHAAEEDEDEETERADVCASESESESEQAAVDMALAASTRAAYLLFRKGCATRFLEAQSERASERARDSLLFSGCGGGGGGSSSSGSSSETKKGSDGVGGAGEGTEAWGRREGVDGEVGAAGESIEQSESLLCGLAGM
jgi:hypothetical protein